MCGEGGHDLLAALELGLGIWLGLRLGLKLGLRLELRLGLELTFAEADLELVGRNGGETA